MRKFKLLSLMAVIATTLSLSFLACQKSEEVIQVTKPKQLDIQAFVSKEGTVYDYDKYGTMVYNHAKYFDGTFDASQYLPTAAALKFKNEFPAYLAQQQALYPTLQSALEAYVEQKVFSVNEKNLILGYTREVTDYLESSNNLSFEDINDFIIEKENAIVQRSDLNDGEKMSVLPLSSIVRNYLKIKYENYLAKRQNGAEIRGDCPWYKISECIYALVYTGLVAAKFAKTGAIVGASIGIAGGPAGVAVGGIIGGAIGAAVGISINISKLKSCNDACLAANSNTSTNTADPCKGATDLAIKINGCGLTQEFVATGQGSGVNIFQGPVIGATVPNIISTVPTFSLTQSNPNSPIKIAIISGCAPGGKMEGIGEKIFNIAQIVGDAGFVDILGPRNGCLTDGDCYSLGGSYQSNPNNSATFDIPSSNDYAFTIDPNGGVCIDWKKEGTYTFSSTVTNACSGATQTSYITVKVKEGVCE